MVPFLLAAALLAQRGVPALPFPDSPTEIELYLGLSKTESRLLQSLTYGTDIQLIELDKADARLADEVLLATEREDIRPLELGPLHVLLERNRRERTRLDAERIRLLKQALSTAQLQRLEGLEQALRLRSVIQSGISFGILPVDCSLRSSIGNPRCTPHWLPIGVGWRAAELELLRRQAAQRELRRITERQALLTNEQRTKLANLRDAARLRDTIADARALKLLESRCREISIYFGGESIFDFELFSYYSGACPDRRSLDEQP